MEENKTKKERKSRAKQIRGLMTCLLCALVCKLVLLLSALASGCAPVGDDAQSGSVDAVLDGRPIDVKGCLPDVVPVLDDDIPTACEYGEDWMLCKHGTIWRIETLVFYTDPDKSCQWARTEVLTDFDQVDPSTWGLYHDLTIDQTNQRQVWESSP